MSDRPALICFDGSETARAAVQRAGELLPGRKAIVLSVWTGAPAQAGLRNRVVGYREAARVLDKAAAAWGKETAQKGVALAAQAGLGARSLVRGSRRDSAAAIADVIDQAAEAEDVAVIVLGSRGLTAPKSWFVGSVSHTVSQRSQRPVLIIPH